MRTLRRVTVWKLPPRNQERRRRAMYALVLELVEGDPLDDVIRRGPVPIGEALSIARAVAT